MHLSIVQPLNPHRFDPVFPYDASYQASVRSLDKSLRKRAAPGLVPGNLSARRCGNTVNPERLDRCVDNELQCRVVVGLKASILQFEPALLGMDQEFPPC